MHRYINSEKSKAPDTLLFLSQSTTQDVLRKKKANHRIFSLAYTTIITLIQRLRRTVALTTTTTTRIAAMPFQRCASSSATSCSFTSSSSSAFSGNTRAQLQQKLYRRLPQKRYYSASVSSEQQQQQQQQKQTSSFADLGVPKQIVDLLRNAGIEKPSVAQLAALPELIDLRKLGGEAKRMLKRGVYLCHRLRCNRIPGPVKRWRI